MGRWPCTTEATPKLLLIDQVRVDNEENLRVRAPDNYGSDVATWVILSSDGRPIGLVATPRALQMTEIGREPILGVAEDQDGVEYVELFRFARPGGCPQARGLGERGEG